MRLKMGIGICIAMVIAAAVPAFAAQGRGNKGKGAQGQGPADHVNISVTFGSSEQRIIREWFAQPSNLKGLPPGLAKKEQLPPGLERQLVRNGQLPPGLQKKIQPLPYVLETRLPPLAEGHKRVVISGSVILFDEGRNTILDVFVAF